LINYYNENDPKAAAWLRELIKDGHIANGIVDERSIKDVQPNDLTDFTQCHFFAGIGGWSYALRLAGVADSERVWTGSCPCQPFSAAGKGKGFADERHLWPAWHWLVSQCRPDIIFGEQVANALAWFDLVSADLEVQAYAVGAAIIGAHSVGAPHIRQRLYWVADSQRGTSERHRQQVGGPPRVYQGNTQERQRLRDDSRNGELVGELADTASEQQHGSGDAGGRRGEPSDCGIVGNLEHAEGDGRLERGTESGGRGSEPRREFSDVGHAVGERLEGRGVPTSGRADERSPWSASDLVWCRDGKWRPVEPGTFPLAHGIPARMGRLRGYGNAIVPQVAAEFVRATMESGHGC
jgi:DNA (cytosine-5)-methyltransferase 1